jgi:hypothetical protein
MAGISQVLTEMVDNGRFGPLGAVRARLVVPLLNGSIEHEVVELILPKLLLDILGERFDALQVRELERQHAECMGRLVVGHGAKSSLSGLGVPGAQDEVVRLAFAEQLLDCLKAL